MASCHSAHMSNHHTPSSNCRPFLLPCLAIGAVGILAIFSNSFWLEETLPRLQLAKARRKAAQQVRQPAPEASASSAVQCSAASRLSRWCPCRMQTAMSHAVTRDPCGGASQLAPATWPPCSRAIPALVRSQIIRKRSSTLQVSPYGLHAIVNWDSKHLRTL